MPNRREPPADVGHVLLDEFRAVRRRRRLLARGWAGPAHPRPPTPQVPTDRKLERYYGYVHRLRDLSALCLSGGGIRSAAFALGVVQGLAARGLLTKFDYLSTVSGGGYLGSFLTAWVQRHGYDTVVQELTRGPTPHAGFAPLQHLRRYSNYLTPRTGLISADMLTVIGLYVRNLLLNWLVLVPMLLLAIMAVKLLALWPWRWQPSAELVALLAIAAVGFIGAAVVDSLQQRPGWVDERSNRARFLRLEMFPMLIGGVLASLATLKYYDLQQMSGSRLSLTIGVTFIGAGIFLIAGIAALTFAPPPELRRRATRDTIRTVRFPVGVAVLAALVFAGALSGLTLAAVTNVASGLASQHPGRSAFLLICLGPPLLILAFFAGELVYVALTSYVTWGDAEREWLARAAGYHGRTAVTWTLVLVLVFLGSYVIFDLYANSSWGTLTGVASTGSVAGIVSALVAKASTTAATLKERYDSLKNRSAPFILAIALPVFVVITVSFLSAGIDALVNDVIAVGDDRRWLWFTPATKSPQAQFWPRLLWWVLIVAVVAVGASLAINTNRFSLHGVYRNRLIRAFLGASNRDRSPNAFIDFDQKDNVNLHELWPNERLPGHVPPQFLVTNMALNIVATRELAWQERKALSFTASPLWIGCAGLIDPNDDPTGRLRAIKGFYRRADEYGGPMSLGTAMTISGAAASPNMGYHSSPALSVLLTFFNVRLGAWLGNPGPAGDKTYEHQGPRFAAKPLVQEALGLTTDNKKYVYLSDGGHFENLGLYEMVRRRCHVIIVSDAGCDPSAGFEDLGNAVRKISIDQNVIINFRALKIGPRRDPPLEGPYCAVADIVYPEPNAAPGILLYVKPGYHGVEPASVRSYAAQSPVFPHESTGDQWFGESQFEAYRALGQHVINTLDGRAAQPYAEIRDFITAVAARLERRYLWD